MKIKRYTAPSMRAALAQVRSEQGPDAVILSSRRGEEGIEVIAAVDYDEALFVDATRQRGADPVIAPPAAPPLAPVPIPALQADAVPVTRAAPAPRAAPMARTAAAFASRQAQLAGEETAPARPAVPPHP